MEAQEPLLDHRRENLEDKAELKAPHLARPVTFHVLLFTVAGIAIFTIGVLLGEFRTRSTQEARPRVGSGLPWSEFLTNHACCYSL